MQNLFQKSLFYFHDQTDKLYKHHHKTLFVIALIVIAYFVHSIYENKQQQAVFLADPQIDDVLILDMGHINTDRKYQAQYRVAQVLQVGDETVTLKQGSYTYRKKRGAERAIKLDSLMLNNYFRPALLSFKKSELSALYDKGAIDEIYRPTDIYVMGGIVRHRAMPERVPHKLKIAFNQYNQEGVQAYLARDFEEARKLFTLAAEQGHDWGQYNLADMLEYGEGGNIDLAGAYKWYKSAAEQSNLKAKAALESFCDKHKALCR
ncbi:MAG: hypothetical protein CMK64_07290 [Pseudoalteromonas sp.]|nr:hypothetical protein [Pseudoalteromonas sp.]|tara:strand:+ start:1409 stop:2197 length:789 start_codon:yes stop_codon:yes gene_type:complete